MNDNNNNEYISAADLFRQCAYDDKTIAAIRAYRFANKPLFSVIDNATIGINKGAKMPLSLAYLFLSLLNDNDKFHNENIVIVMERYKEYANDNDIARITNNVIVRKKNNTPTPTQKSDSVMMVENQLIEELRESNALLTATYNDTLSRLQEATALLAQCDNEKNTLSLSLQTAENTINENAITKTQLYNEKTALSLSLQNANDTITEKEQTITKLTNDKNNLSLSLQNANDTINENALTIQALTNDNNNLSLSLKTINDNDNAKTIVQRGMESKSTMDLFFIIIAVFNVYIGYTDFTHLVTEYADAVISIRGVIVNYAALIALVLPLSMLYYTYKRPMLVFVLLMAVLDFFMILFFLHLLDDASTFKILLALEFATVFVIFTILKSPTLTKFVEDISDSFK